QQENAQVEDVIIRAGGDIVDDSLQPLAAFDRHVVGSGRNINEGEHSQRPRRQITNNGSSVWLRTELEANIFSRTDRALQGDIALHDSLSVDGDRVIQASGDGEDVGQEADAIQALDL